LKGVAAASGISAGRAFGAAAQGALAAAGGFMAGKFAGASGASGAATGLTAITTGLAAGLAIGGPWGAAVGGATGAMTLLGAAFGRADAAAKKFKEQVGQVTAALKGDLQAAAESGVVSMSKLRAGLLSVTDVANLDSVAGQFSEALGADGRKVLQDLGLTWEKSIKPILKDGGDLDVMNTKFTDTFANAAGASSEFQKRFGGDAEAMKKLLADLLRPGGGSSLNDLLSAADDAGGGLSLLITQNQGFLENLINTAGDVTRTNEAVKASIDDINNSTNFLSKPGQGGGAWSKLFDLARVAIDKGAVAAEEMKTKIASIGVAAQGSLIDLQNLFSFGTDSPLQKAVDDAILSVSGIGQQMVDASGKNSVVGGAEQRRALDQFGGAIRDVVQKGIDDGVVVSPADPPGGDRRPRPE